MKTRNANLDVFRCLAMFLVVLSHVWQHGSEFDKTPATEMLMWGGLRWHVDAFLALSGWFGMTFTFRKFFKLYGVIALFCLLDITVSLFVGTKPRLMLTGGWYANTYLCLMLVIPFVNAGIEKLREDGLRTLWSAWAGFAVVIWYNWATRNPYLGLVAWDVVPFSLVQMVFIYFTVRNIRFTLDQCNNEPRFLRFGICLSIVIFAVVTVGLVFVVRRYGSSEALMQRVSYLAPHVILMAVAMLVLFDRYVRCPNWLGKLCVWLAPSMFSVYLLHGLPACSYFLRDVAPVWLIGNGINQWVALLLGAITCFALCVSIDLMRRGALNVFRRNRVRS